MREGLQRDPGDRVLHQDQVARPSRPGLRISGGPRRQRSGTASTTRLAVRHSTWQRQPGCSRSCPPAGADSDIACWEAKYHYNFWRPFPAIVNGDLDGNAATHGDGAWRPLLATPPHPDYPSGHSSNSSAMGTVLRQLLGDDPGVQIQLTFFGATRQWQTFEEAVDEVIEARIYSGIHFRTADDVGAKLGRKVAHFVMTHALRPPKGSWKNSGRIEARHLLRFDAEPEEILFGALPATWRGP